jgi:acyl-CoA reductase-like NAD-dependent aldehyde dehydrogenase
MLWALIQTDPALMRLAILWADEPHVPLRGVKNSGVGREGGGYSMDEMTELKWITVQMGQRQFPF